MNLRRILKNICIILIFILIIGCFSCGFCFAKKIDTEIEIEYKDVGMFNKLGNGILSTVYVIGVFASVAALMIKGIKFMLR